MTTLTITGLSPSTFDEIRGDVADIIDDELLDLGELIERGSPKGVSGTGSSLSSSWDIKPATISANGISASVLNPLPFALERLAGRGPGKQPPVDNLRRWAQARGISPYAVAKKIGREGTERYKRGKDGNLLRIDPQSKEVPTNEGPQKETTDKIVARIAGLKY